MADASGSRGSRTTQPSPGVFERSTPALAQTKPCSVSAMTKSPRRRRTVRASRSTTSTTSSASSTRPSAFHATHAFERLTDQRRQIVPRPHLGDSRQRNDSKLAHPASLTARAPALPQLDAPGLRRMEVARRFALPEHADDAVRLQDRGLHLAQVGESLTPSGRKQLRQGYAPPAERILDRLAVLYELGGLPFNQSFGPRELVGHAIQAFVQGEEDPRPDEGPCHRDVVADDAALDGVRHEQEHDEVERVRLPELAFADHAQDQDQ